MKTMNKFNIFPTRSDQLRKSDIKNLFDMILNGDIRENFERGWDALRFYVKTFVNFEKHRE